MKTQKFGIEIELTGITRKKAADVIAEYFGKRNFISGRIIKLTGQKTVKEERGKQHLTPVLLHREKRVEEGSLPRKNINVKLLVRF